MSNNVKDTQINLVIEVLNRTPNLIWLRSFEASARLLKFTEAGRELGLTQTAISLHIRTLEDTLGCKLFIRKARHLSLSAVGEAYLHTVRDALNAIDTATLSLFGPQSRGTITVRAPISTATLWLAPYLPQFTKDYPGINIRLVSTIWATSISDEDVDVDIRQGLGHWPGFEAEKISTETIVPIRQAAPARTTNGAFIQVLGNENMRKIYVAAQPEDPIGALTQITVDTTVAAVSLVASGGGHSVVQERFARQAIAAGMTIAISGPPVPFPQSHYFMQGKTQKAHRPEVEVFKSWLRGIFAD